MFSRNSYLNLSWSISTFQRIADCLLQYGHILMRISALHYWWDVWTYCPSHLWLDTPWKTAWHSLPWRHNRQDCESRAPIFWYRTSCYKLTTSFRGTSESGTCQSWSSKGTWAAHEWTGYHQNTRATSFIWFPDYWDPWWPDSTLCVKNSSLCSLS